MAFSLWSCSLHRYWIYIQLINAMLLQDSKFKCFPFNTLYIVYIEVSMFYQNRCMGFCYYFFPCEIQPLNFQLLSHQSVKHKSKSIWLDISSWNSCTGPIFQRIRNIDIWELSICTKSIQETEVVKVKPKTRQWKYPDCCRLNTWSRYMYIHALLGTVNGL